ncbi:uncharacterized protein DUF2125 [Rhodovulum bhavnagarense]|uniref:Uncharacterized protein DUF2125 n=1 Tax=Rhodovulum bhavnagarense TaxID=992286 RepID=A0A4R2RDS8_9RHOB|nr:DUF2125 domain-containing protein [Rhodovulum bhavnagarense]TCP61622.1 uncharacterized protein DUF2125 [Rhodovulum bhavnagarense]
MTYPIAASAGALALGFFCAAPSLADVTAPQVWEAWKSLAERGGQTVSGTEARTGGRLTVSGLVLSMTMEDGTTSSVSLGDLVFSERGDGTVEIAMAPDYPVLINTRSDGGAPVDMAMSVRQSGLSLVASGTPEALRYDFSAPEMGVRMDSLSVDGTPVEAEFDMTLTQPAGRYLLEQGAPGRFDSALEAAAIRIAAAGRDAEDGARVTLSATMTGVSSVSAGTLPAAIANADPGAVLAAGLDVSGRLAHQGLDYVIEMSDETGPSKITTRAAAGGLDFGIGEGRMSYAIDSTSTRATFSGPGFPLPQVEIAMDETAFGLQMPMSPTEEPADFAMLARLAGLTLGEQVWTMLDPAGQLPRDPATLMIDLAGKSRWKIDITDPAADMGGAAPGELHALSIRNLRLDLVGAELTGKGDFTFDNADTATFGGMPRPEGRLSLRLEGGNALLDRMVGMGLIPAEQATGFRMMLGMFARPGDGVDTLVSDIEVDGAGQVMANGQRLR